MESVVVVVAEIVPHHHDVGILPVVDIQHREIPDALAVFFLLVEVDSEIKSVARWQLIIVAALIPGQHLLSLPYRAGPSILATNVLYCWVVGYCISARHRAPGAAHEVPFGVDVDALVDIVAQCDIHHMVTVVLVWELSPLVDASIGKPAACLAKGVVYPSVQLAYGFLGHQLYAVALAVAHLHLGLPACGTAHGAHSLLVLKQVLGIFVIGLGCKFPTLDSCVAAAQRVVRCVHGLYVFGGWHP